MENRVLISNIIELINARFTDTYSQVVNWPPDKMTE